MYKDMYTLSIYALSSNKNVVEGLLITCEY